MHVYSSTVIHYASKNKYFTLPYDFVRLQKVNWQSLSRFQQWLNTFFQLLQDQANSSQQVFLLVDDIFIGFLIDLSRTSASHKCCRGGGGAEDHICPCRLGGRLFGTLAKK